jgi:hypothetical protein
MIIKVLGAQISIASANTVANATLVRVINTGALAVCNIGSIGNVSISNTESVLIQKAPTDTLTGANMLAVPVAFKN